MSEQWVRNQARQGDLFFRRVEELPGEVKPAETGIIARGSATGHAHRLSEVSMGAGAKVFQDADGKMYMLAIEGTQLVHDEHPTIVFTEGVFEVLRQREHRPEGWDYVDD